MAEQEVKAIFSADTSGITSGAREAVRAMQSVKTGASSISDAVSASMSAIGKTMIGVGAATTAMGVKAVKGFGDFEASLNKAAVIAGGTSKDINGLADVANRLGAELPLSAQDAADAMVAMARDGASISTIKKEFPAIAEAATAAGADLQTTASVVQQSMNIWGDSLKSPQRSAAILTQTANLSNASIEDMQQALATIGGTAVNAGIDMQTTSIALGLLTNRGFSAAQASQDLNHAILLMQAPSKKGAEQMHALGLSMTDAKGNMKPLPTIINDIADSMQGMTSSQQAAALKTMFGTAGMAAILPLMKSVKDNTDNATTSWSAFANQMQSASADTATATKFLQEQATEMQKNLGSKIEQVGGNWESLSNKAMAGSSSVTGAFLDMINGALTWAGDSNSAIASVIRQFIGLSPAIGAGTLAIGGFLTNATKIISTVKSLGIAIGSLFVTPIGLAIVAITAFASAIGLAYKYSEPFRKAIASVGKAFSDVFTKNAKQSTSELTKFGGTVTSVMQKVGEAFGNKLAKAINSVNWEKVFTKINNVLTSVIKVVTQMVQVFGMLAVKVADSAAAATTWDIFAGILTTVYKGVQLLYDKFKQVYDILGNIGGAGSNTGRTLQSAFALTGVLGSIAILSRLPRVLSLILSPARSISGAFGSMLSSILPFGGGAEKAASAATKATKPFSNLALKTLEVGAGVGLAAAGIGALAFGISSLSSQGEQGTTTLQAFGIAVGLLAGEFALLGGALTRGALGIGVLLGGLTALALAMAALAKTGKQGQDTMITFSLAISGTAAAFAILGPLLTYSAVGIGVFGAAILAAGIGIGAASAGLALLITTMNSSNISAQNMITTMSAMGVAFAAMIVSFLTAIMTQAPIIVLQFTNMIVGILTVIATQLPAMIQAGVNLIVNFLQGIILAIPQIAPVIMNLIVTIVSTIVANLPTIVQQGVNLILAIINGIVTAVPQIVPALINMFIVIMDTIAQNLPQLIISGMHLVVSFIQGITQAIPQVIPAVIDMIVTFINAVAGKLPDIINAGVNLLIKFIQGISDAIPRIIGVVVALIIKFIDSVGDHLGEIIDAGIGLLEKFIMGIVNAIPRLTNTAVKAVEQFAYGVGYALGSVLGSGHRLMDMFINGIRDGYGNASQSGSGAGESVKNGIGGIDLFGAGQAIMSSFLSGLQSMWGSITSFVGGIASWIKSHKGPISYDRRLLIPAGKSIMQGLNEGLKNDFKDVQKTVQSVAPFIQDALSGNSDYTINTQLSNGLDINNGSLSVDMNNNAQPALINVSMGGSDWRAYVDDISNTQGNSARLSRNNSVYL